MCLWRRFPPYVREPGGRPDPGAKDRAFHQLTKDEQATIEKKRLSEYCRRAYKKVGPPEPTRPTEP